MQSHLGECVAASKNGIDTACAPEVEGGAKVEHVVDEGINDVVEAAQGPHQLLEPEVEPTEGFLVHKIPSAGISKSF